MSTGQPSTQEMAHFLLTDLVASLLCTHPNTVPIPTFVPPQKWRSWWSWACTPCPSSPKWILLLRYYMLEEAADTNAWLDIPDELKIMINQARLLQFDRRPADAFTNSASYNGRGDARGMSPKKAHEVQRMTGYVANLLDGLEQSGHGRVRHVVDVGAGQAYLSRSLRDELGLNVLALDWSDVQTHGAAKKERGPSSRNSRKRSNSATIHHKPELLQSTFNHTADVLSESKGSLSYETIRVTPTSLFEATNAWVKDTALASKSEPPTPTPILFVALHACGSLTPDTLRTVVSSFQNSGARDQLWTPCAAVIVGCCYNLMKPDDFPLSQVLSSSPLRLTANHLQLAAQIPAQWTHSAESMVAARLATRKVVWRALLECILQQPKSCDDSSTKRTQGHKSHEGERPRLGKLNDVAYTDWKTFIERAAQKLALNMDVNEEHALDAAMESGLEVLHVLRCILGVIVEGVILLDREQWLKEQLRELEVGVKLVNLFDQALGSGRNVAVCIIPEFGI